MLRSLIPALAETAFEVWKLLKRLNEIDAEMTEMRNWMVSKEYEIVI